MSKHPSPEELISSVIEESWVHRHTSDPDYIAGAILQKLADYEYEVR